MTGEQITLQAELRKTGKGTCRGLRRQKRVPCVVYGPKMENLEISVEEKELVKYLKSKYENTIFKINGEGSAFDNLQALRKETDIHPVTRRPTHVDFYALDLTTETRVYVEVHFEGKSVGVREGGVLNVAHREVEIECLPTNIPEYLTIDITDLNINESLHVSDLTVPEGITILTPETQTLCTIATVEEEVAAPVAAPEGEAAEGDEAAPAGGEAPAADAEKKEESKPKKD